MKITAILGSPHGMKGNTAGLLDALVRSAAAAGAEVEVMSLTDYDVRPCRGCDACHKVGKCVIDDDFHTLHDAMVAADGVVIASPNYIFSVSAQLKALMDRCCGPIHLQELTGRYGAAVVTSGASGSEDVEQYIQRFLQGVGCWTVGGVGASMAEIYGPDGGQASRRRAAKLGTDLVEAIRAGEVPADQKPGREAFFQRMKGLVTAMKDSWPYEYDYWKAHGRL